jgi:hypothetical protein
MGRDGVGDYSRCLALECVRQGHPCSLLSFQDPFITEPTYLTEDESIAILRLPASLPLAKRVQLGQRFIETCNPDWISLQFVCYGFHPKGILFHMEQAFPDLVRGRKLHIMFHELWIGISLDSSLKERFMGWIQRQSLLRLVRRLNPQVCHSSNTVYTTLLNQHRIPASILPLFGSIPISSKVADSWLFPLLQQQGIQITPETRDQFWIVGFFGSLHLNWPPEPLFTHLQKAAEYAKRRVIFTGLGRIGSGLVLWEHIRATYEGSIQFLHLGEQPTERVSEWMNSLDAGIATIPYALIGKSSSVTAMLEHGLPVICNRDDYQVPFPLPLEDPRVYKVGSDFATHFASYLQRVSPQSRLPDITTHFLADLDL